MIQFQNHNIERRKHPRADLKINMHCSSLTGQRDSMINQIRMVDMSQSGIGAVSDRRFQPDERVVLHLPKSHQQLHQHLFARVAWCVSLRQTCSRKPTRRLWQRSGRRIEFRQPGLNRSGCFCISVVGRIP